MAADATAARRDLPQLFAEEMGQLIGPDFPPHLSLAVSGGGDSMAMLFLAAPWARVMGIALEVLTVHHHLRAGAEDEIALVSAAAQELGLPHRVLHWHWDGAGNLGEAARKGRYAALSAAAGEGGHIVVAHTQDDQAETFLMNLARGSGVDGLAAMSPLRRSGEVTLLRPLLGVTRDELRHFLKVLRIDYADDPSNDDPASTRIQMRQAAESLAALGLTHARLAGTATAMARARHALEARTLEAHEALVDRGPGEMLFDLSYARDGFDALDRETQLRLLAAAIRYVGLAPDRPRLATLEDALDRALSGGATTLHGCYLYPHRDRL
ncbi:MAG: tRNA lysidine(34) synthetase TilS, partial [Pseudomonadota bacterium]